MTYKETKDFNGSLKVKYINEAGKLHRESDPAVIYYYASGSVQMEYFFINGISHRELGPAVIQYNQIGSIIGEWFYFNGECLGYKEEGFWKLWGQLTEDKRRSPEILKYLVRYS